MSYVTNREDAALIIEQRQEEIEREYRKRRDRFAAAALTGLLANPALRESIAVNRDDFAAEARDQADALLAALDSQSTTARELEEARRRLREIKDLVADQVDVDDGIPNLAARVQVIARGEDRP